MSESTLVHVGGVVFNEKALRDLAEFLIPRGRTARKVVEYHSLRFGPQHCRQCWAAQVVNELSEHTINSFVSACQAEQWYLTRIFAALSVLDAIR